MCVGSNSGNHGSSPLNMWWTAHSPARSRVSHLPIRSAVSAVISCSSGISAAYCCLDAAAGRSGCRLLCRLICLPSPVDFHINLLLEMQDGQGVRPTPLLSYGERTAWVSGAQMHVTSKAFFVFFRGGGLAPKTCSAVGKPQLSEAVAGCVCVKLCMLESSVCSIQPCLKRLNIRLTKIIWLCLDNSLALIPIYIYIYIYIYTIRFYVYA